MPKRRKASKQPRLLSERMATTPAQYKVIQQHVTTHSSCLLCGTFPSTYQGLFTVDPERSELWGGTRGKFRVFCYALCEPCFLLPDKVFRVEARLMAPIASTRN